MSFSSGFALSSKVAAEVSSLLRVSWEEAHSYRVVLGMAWCSQCEGLAKVAVGAEPSAEVQQEAG